MYRRAHLYRDLLPQICLAAFLMGGATAQAQITGSKANPVADLNYQEPFSQAELLNIWHKGFRAPAFYFDVNDSQGEGHFDFCLSDSKLTQVRTGVLLANLELLKISRQPITENDVGLVPYLYFFKVEFPDKPRNPFYQALKSYYNIDVAYMGLELLVGATDLMYDTSGRVYQPGSFQDEFTMYYFTSKTNPPDDVQNNIAAYPLTSGIYNYTKNFKMLPRNCKPL